MEKNFDKSVFKLCRNCGVVKPYCEFQKFAITKKDGSIRLRSYCTECKREKGREYGKKNRKKLNEYEKKYKKENKTIKKRMLIALQASRRSAKKYGFIPCIASVDELGKSLTGFCFICGISEDSCIKKLSADHDHKTGRFRGWLCNKCNYKVGQLESCDISVIMKYLNSQ